MSEPVGPGDYVECVAGAVGKQGDEVVEVGRLYCVDAVGAITSTRGCRYCKGEHPTGWLRLKSQRRAWCAARFKPTYRRDESLIARLLSDTPTDIPVEA